MGLSDGLGEWDGGDRETQNGGDVCVYIKLIHFAVLHKLTQHCKAAF